MANEFIARNGVIALANSTVSGSLSVTNSVSGSIFTGSFIGNLTGTASYSNLALTASYVSGASSISASYAATASIATSASFASTSSFAFTASYIASVVSASYALTASYAANGGSGGGLGGNALLTQTTAATTWSFTHNLGTQYPVITVYDSGSNSVIQPLNITPSGSNLINIYFSTARAGYATAAVGGGYTVTNGGTTRQLSITSPAATWSFNHGIGDKYPNFQVFDSNDNVLIPSNIQAVDINNATITFAYPATGKVTATLGGGVAVNSGTVITIPSSSATWSLNHFLGEPYPLVTLWESGSNQILQPDTVTSINSGSILVTFTSPVKGWANVSKAGSIVSGSTLWSNIIGGPFTTTGSVTSFTGSLLITGSLTVSGSGTFNNVGPANFTGSVFVTGSLTSTGTITAQTLVVQTVTSSITYSSGSNIFGNATSNTQTFTGSVLISGSSTALNISNGLVQIGSVSSADSVTISKSTYPQIRLVETTTSPNPTAILGYDTPTAEWRLRAVSNHPLAFGTNDIERMRVTSNGWVTFTTGSVYSAGSALLGTNSSIHYNSNGYMYVQGGSGGLWLSAYASTRNNNIALREASNTITFDTNNAEAMRINSSNNLMIGTTSDLGQKLGVYGNIYMSVPGSAVIFMDTSPYGGSYAYNMQVKNNAGNGNFYIQRVSDGTGVYIPFGGTSWGGVSDERLKTDLTEITDASNKVSSLRAVTGRFLTDEETKRRSFLIAQDLQKVLPEAVHEDDETGYLGITYTDVIPLLVAAVKELKSENDSLKSRVETLEQK